MLYVLECYPYTLHRYAVGLVVHHCALVHHCVLFGIINLLHWCTACGRNIEQSSIEHGKMPGKRKGKEFESANILWHTATLE